MLQRLLQDPEFKTLDKKHVRDVFILSGTNNVDGIFSGSQTMADVNKSLSELLCKIWTIFEPARISVINILPRDHRAKNNIVQQLNQFLLKECNAHGLRYVITEAYPEPMFSYADGSRNNNMFANGFDNVHLSNLGYSRIAGYLKYLAHL